MRDIITTAFEVVGLLSVDAGVALAAGDIAPPVGLIVGGLMLIGSSLLILKASGWAATQ